MPCSSTTCPRNATDGANRVHLGAPSVMLNLRSVLNTLFSMDRCSAAVLEKISRSSMYASTLVNFISPIMWSTYLANTAEAVLSPIGIRRYCISPSGVWNAVYCLQWSASGTDQKASFMSSDVKYFAPCRLDKASSTFGSV